MQRVPAKMLYLELEPQPAARRAKTERDNQTKMDSRECDQSQVADEEGAKHHNIEGTRNIKKQANLVKKIELEEQWMKGLLRSFNASAKGTRVPESDGLLGPRRSII